MLCKKPYMQGIQAYGCGQCLPCRINRRRLWQARLVLESCIHDRSCFLTLTYNDEKLPEGGTLVPKHLQDFLKRLRRYFAPTRIRFFAVGEYGDRSLRPHYHLMVYGLDAVQLAGSTCRGLPVSSIWGMGYVFAGSVTPSSCGYIAGYVTKKLTKKGDDRLCGKEPEFARMSLRPGVAAKSMENVASALSPVMRAASADTDVPAVVRIGGKKYPLGRYLRRMLRLALGRDGAPPDGVLSVETFKVRFLLEDALKDQANTSKGIKQILVEMNDQARLNLETRTKVYSQRRIL